MNWQDLKLSDSEILSINLALENLPGFLTDPMGSKDYIRALEDEPSGNRPVILLPSIEELKHLNQDTVIFFADFVSLSANMAVLKLSEDVNELFVIRKIVYGLLSLPKISWPKDTLQKLFDTAMNNETNDNDFLDKICQTTKIHLTAEDVANVYTTHINSAKEIQLLLLLSIFKFDKKMFDNIIEDLDKEKISTNVILSYEYWQSISQEKKRDILDMLYSLPCLVCAPGEDDIKKAENKNTLSFLLEEYPKQMSHSLFIKVWNSYSYSARDDVQHVGNTLFRIAKVCGMPIFDELLVNYSARHVESTKQLVKYILQNSNNENFLISAKDAIRYVSDYFIVFDNSNDNCKLGEDSQEFNGPKLLLEQYSSDALVQIFEEAPNQIIHNLYTVVYICTIHPEYKESLLNKVRALDNTEEDAVSMSAVKLANYDYTYACTLMEFIIARFQSPKQKNVPLRYTIWSPAYASHFFADTTTATNTMFSALKAINHTLPVTLMCEYFKLSNYISRRNQNIEEYTTYKNILSKYTVAQRRQMLLAHLEVAYKVSCLEIFDIPIGQEGDLLDNREYLQAKFHLGKYESDLESDHAEQDDKFAINLLAKYSEKDILRIANALQADFEESWFECEDRIYSKELIAQVIDTILDPLAEADGYILNKYFYVLPFERRMQAIEDRIKHYPDHFMSLHSPAYTDGGDMRWGKVSTMYWIAPLESFVKHNFDYSIFYTLYPTILTTWKEQISDDPRTAIVLPTIDKVADMIAKDAHHRDDENIEEHLQKTDKIMSWLYFVIICIGKGIESNDKVEVDPEILAEILRFADPKKRILVTEKYFSMLKNKDVYSKYQELKELAIFKKEFLIAILVAELYVDSGDNPKNIQIVGNISRAYRDNSKFKYLVAGIVSLVADNNMTSHEKLCLIRDVMRPTTLKFTTAKSESDAKRLVLIELCQSKESNRSRKFILVEVGKNFYLAGFRQDNKLFFANVDTKLLQKLKVLLEKQVKNGVNIAKHKNNPTVLQVIESITSIGTQLSYEISCWDCIAGLAGINRIPLLKTLSFRDAYMKGIAEVFKLTASQSSKFYDIFANRHNYMSLLAYYSGLKKLKNNYEQDIYSALVDKYVQLVCDSSAQNRDAFAEYRYSEKDNPHLVKVFKDRDLRNTWIQGHSVPLIDIYNMYNLSSVEYQIGQTVDVPKIVKDAILNEHIKAPGISLNVLKEKANASLADREKQIALYESDIKNLCCEDGTLKRNDTMQRFRLNIQINLLKLCDETDIKKQLSLASRVADNLMRIGLGNQQIIQDLATLKDALRIKIKSQDKQNNSTESVTFDTKGLTIVDTDDDWRLFMAGTDVKDSCQSTTGDPELNKCLIGGYVLSGHIRELAIINSENKLIARAMLRLVYCEETDSPALMIEEVYPKTTDLIHKLCLYAFACERARALKLNLIGKPLDRVRKVRDFEHDLQVLFMRGCEYVDFIHSTCNMSYSIGNGAPVLFDIDKYKQDMEREALAQKIPQMLFSKTDFEKRLETFQHTSGESMAIVPYEGAIKRAKCFPNLS